MYLNDMVIRDEKSFMGCPKNGKGGTDAFSDKYRKVFVGDR